MDRKYESEALMVSHQSTESLFRLGVIDADEMREFDEMCLAQETETDEAEKPMAMEPVTA